MRKIILILLSLSALSAHGATTPGLCHEDTPGKLLRDVAPLIDLSVEKLPGQAPQPTQVAGIYGEEDTRLLVPKHAPYPFTALGKISWGNAQCTAVMVGRCHILTARHCLDRAKQKTGSAEISFVSADEKSRSTINVSQSGQDAKTLSEGDWAVARLDSSLGDRTGWMGLSAFSGKNLSKWITGSCNKDGKLILAGYSIDIDQGKSLSIDDQVEMIRHEKTNLLRFRGQSFQGSSGSPIWRYDCQGNPEIVALNTTAAYNPVKGGQAFLPANETKNLAAGIATDEFFGKMKAFVKKYPCAAE
ncbi:MAG: trypsin-like serine protease [Bdellovibrionaceae bacterium]|nr:trypsin-like serine protease [Pseudobdellovibrionaceae bacterium]MBX3034732.1 trypsin-like serine protease [Pseudobdellovibrionaceae bacterium]